MASGYSGKPLHEKLGVKAGQRICVIGAPVDYHKLLEGDVKNLQLSSDPGASADMAHIFETKTARLRAQLPKLMKAIAPAGAIWVSWPKKTARMDTDITEDIIRQVAIPLGLVDVKVCAVNDVWSGLKLMIRRERR